MRVMLDTNVLVSALLFPSERMNARMEYIFTQHELVLSSYVVEELKLVVRRKFPRQEAALAKLLLLMNFEYVYTPDEIDGSLFDIRDAKDYPVLYTAIIENIDVLITGDKDFAEVRVDRPRIMTPTEFMDYCQLKID